MVQSLIPAPKEVYGEEGFFGKPLLPVVTFHDIETFYGCPPIESKLIEAAELTDAGMSNNNFRL